MIILFGTYWPYYTCKDPIRIGSLLEHILERPLAFRIAIAGDLHEDALRFCGNGIAIFLQSLVEPRKTG